MDELYFSDEKHISASRASRISGYAQDYIGQMCRGGALRCRKVGRNWYIAEADLLGNIKRYKREQQEYQKSYVRSYVGGQGGEKKKPREEVFFSVDAGPLLPAPEKKRSDVASDHEQVSVSEETTLESDNDVHNNVNVQESSFAFDVPVAIEDDDPVNAPSEEESITQASSYEEIIDEPIIEKREYVQPSSHILQIPKKKGGFNFSTPQYAPLAKENFDLVEEKVDFPMISYNKTTSHPGIVAVAVAGVIIGVTLAAGVFWGIAGVIDYAMEEGEIVTSSTSVKVMPIEFPSI